VRTARPKAKPATPDFVSKAPAGTMRSACPARSKARSKRSASGPVSAASIIPPEKRSVAAQSPGRAFAARDARVTPRRVILFS